MARPSLLVLASRRLDRLDALLVAAGAARRSVASLDDALALFSLRAAADAILLVDLDETPITDAGLLRRWCDQNPDAELCWVGGDAERALAFADAGVSGARLRWPLDLDDLDRLARGLATDGEPSQPAPAPAPSPPEGNSIAAAPAPRDLTRIEAILGRDATPESPAAPPAEVEAPKPAPGHEWPQRERRPAPPPPPRDERAQVAPRRAFLAAGTPPAPDRAPALDEMPTEDPLAYDGPILTDEELDAFFAPEPIEGPPVEAPEPRTEPERTAAPPERRPAWLRQQIADLADIVQGLDLRARANHAHVGLEDDLARLRQFTRTIGYVAAPPPRGEQRFDLATLVEEQLGALAGREADAPRLLFRRDVDDATVEADKLLVVMALEAVLQTAVGCASASDVVRVSVGPATDGGTSVRVQFPAGPIADLDPESVLEPYALKGRLEGIGANALAAAGAIAVGQGGDLVVREEDPATRILALSFPSPAGA
ncbi:MAG: hypothetical protein AAGA20_13770 [Planctomycetota bacterium]